MSKEYALTAKILHWTMAAIILISIPIAYYMSGLPEESDFKWSLYDLHESLGITLLLLVIVRFVWRKTHPVMITSQHPTFVTMVHRAFYVILFVLPIIGWLMNSAGGYPIPWFGLELPALTNKNEAMAKIMGSVHFYIGYFLVILIAMHIAGALKKSQDGKSSLHKMLASSNNKS